MRGRFFFFFFFFFFSPLARAFFRTFLATRFLAFLRGAGDFAWSLDFGSGVVASMAFAVGATVGGGSIWANNTPTSRPPVKGAATIGAFAVTG